MVEDFDSDPYVYPGTVYVLKNKHGVRDAEKLEQVEALLFDWRFQQLTPDFPSGDFDYRHLKAVHRHLFQDLYEWAGEQRTVNLTKNDTRFATIQFIGPSASKVFGELKDQGYLRGLNRDEFAELAAHYYAELNAVHPFREGNGRTLNAFMTQLTYKAGHELHWSRTTQDEYLNAVRASFFVDNRKLAALFRRLIEPIG